MESQFSAGRAFPTFDAHLEGSFTANTKLIFTLGAGEVHASTFGSVTTIETIHSHTVRGE